MSSFVRLKHTRLFHGLIPAEIDSILHCLPANSAMPRGPICFTRGIPFTRWAS